MAGVREKSRLAQMCAMLRSGKGVSFFGNSGVWLATGVFAFSIRQAGQGQSRTCLVWRCFHNLEGPEKGTGCRASASDVRWLGDL